MGTLYDIWLLHMKKKILGMFGNYFFLLFFVSKKKKIYFWNKKTCLAIQNRQKTKFVFKTQFVKLWICLVTIFFSYFLFLNIYIFEIKKLVWQLKMNRKQKLFSKLNLRRKLKICKRLFSISNFQKSMKICI